MTLPTTNNLQNSSGSDKQLNSQSGSDAKSLSPSSSPRGSPRPSPRTQHKREHSRSDSHLSAGYREAQTSTPIKNDSSQNLEINSQNPRAPEQSFIELSRSDSHESTTGSISKRDKDPKTSDRPKKKSSWYNVLYPTYKSRSEDFKRIFKDVPDDERLVVDYSCALQKEILVHGRLYVTQNYLCFYANIFRWETTVTLQWKDVTAITKEKTALVIPNAILLSTDSDKYFLTSFSARDKTYLMLFRVWQNALMDQPMSAQEMWQWVHQCYGDELGLTSDDEDYIAPGSEDLKQSARISVESFSEDCTGDPLMDGSLTGDDRVDDDCLPPISVFRDLHNSRHSPDAQLPTDMSDTTESDVERNGRYDELPTVSGVVCTGCHEGRQVLNESYPMHVDQLFTLLFTSSKFYLDFHASRRTADLTQTAWTHNCATGQKTRVVTLTVAITQAIGPKSSQVTETQVMLPCSRPGHLYSIDVETVNAGIPYADSFYVTVHYCIQRISDVESHFSVFAQIKYRKSVWGLVKGLIEKNSWIGLEDFFNSLAKALHLECEEIIHPVVKRKSRRRRKAPIIGDVNENSHHHHGSRVLPAHVARQPRFECVTWMVLIVLILLVILNVALYYKLWMLEDAPPYTLLDLHVLKEPPKSHEEWLKLLQQQETLHSVEMQKWQRVLKSAVQLLRQTEESLSELQHSIHPTSSDRIVSVLQSHRDQVENAATVAPQDEL
ncbi:GRAM domain containing 1B [Carabus blaptoides fortunei]